MNIPINSNTAILGDFNVDFMKNKPDSQLLNKSTLLKSFDQLIQRPTRVTCDTQTLIDHIYISNSNLYHHWGVVDPGISDHCLVFTSRKYKSVSKEKETCFIQSYRNFDPLAVAQDVANIDWDDIYVASNLDKAVSIFNILFPQQVNKHMPLKKIRTQKT